MGTISVSEIAVHVSASILTNFLPFMARPRGLSLAVNTHVLTSLLTDPFAEADEDTGETKQSQNYIHIRIQRTYSRI
jgi:hypothetical protein